MSGLPGFGSTIDLDGIAREFRSRRGSGPDAYDVYTIEQRIASNSSPEDGQSGQTAGTYWNMYGMAGKYRHYYTWGGYEQPKGGYYATSSTPAGFTDLWTGYMDDSYVQFNMPFNICIGGSYYSTGYVGSNGYITFGGGSSQYSGLSYGAPAYNKIMFGSGDRNMTYCGIMYHTGYDSTQGSIAVTIRYEGNSSYSTNTTRGSADSVVEITFINWQNTVNRYGQGIAINTGAWVNSTFGGSGMCFPSGAYFSWTMAAGTSYGLWLYEGTYTNGSNFSGNWYNGALQAGNYWNPYPQGSG
jgi:hypothetical protein